MKKFWKIVGIILGILVILAVLGWIWWETYGKKIWDNIIFQNFGFSGVDLKGLTLQDIPDILLKGEQRQIPVTMGMEILNKNKFSIPFCYLQAEFFYKGNPIAKTSDNLAKTCIRIPAQGEPNNPFPVSDPVTITLSRAGGAQLITDKLLGGKPEIDYEVSLSIFGIPVPINVKNSFLWDEEL